MSSSADDISDGGGVCMYGIFCAEHQRLPVSEIATWPAQRRGISETGRGETGGELQAEVVVNRVCTTATALTRL